MSLSYRWTALFGTPATLLSPTSAHHALARPPAAARNVVTPQVSTPLPGSSSRVPHGADSPPSKPSDHTSSATGACVPTSADHALRAPLAARNVDAPQVSTPLPGSWSSPSTCPGTLPSIPLSLGGAAPPPP